MLGGARAILEQWPAYLAYLISFATIGAVWMAHSAITEFLDCVDPLMLRINLLLLLVVGFVPVPTRLLAEYLDSAEGERVAVTFYGVALLATRLMVLWLWRCGVTRRLVIPDLTDADARGVSQKLTPSLTGYVLARPGAAGQRRGPLHGHRDIPGRSLSLASTG